MTEAFISKRKQTLSLGSFHVVYVVLWMVAHIPLTDLLKARVLLLRVAHTDDTPYKPGERDINGHIREEPRKHCVRQASLNCEGWSAASNDLASTITRPKPNCALCASWCGEN